MKNALTAHVQLSREKNKLSYEDPFDAAPDDNVKEVPVVEEPTVIKSEAVGSGEGKIVSTYKEGAGYEASWTVVHAESVDDWFGIHEHPRFKELLDRQKKVAGYFRDKPTTASQQQNQPNPSYRAPQGAQEAPGGEKRFCSHGEMVFKSGISKAGNAYKLFSCPAPRQEQCQAQYLK